MVTLNLIQGLIPIFCFSKQYEIPDQVPNDKNNELLQITDNQKQNQFYK